MSSKLTRGRVLIAGALLALVIAACGSAATPAPSAAPASSAAPAATPAPTTAGGAGDPIGALADLTSYKLKMVIDSQDVTGGLGALGNISMEGTVILKPAKAADMTLTMGGAGTGIRVVEVNGKQYVDMGTGLVQSTDTSQSSMVDSLSPEKMFGSFGTYASQMKVVGDETKNGVATTHLQASSDLLSTLGTSLGSTLGLANGTWSMDTWVAKDGGYAVSWVMKGTGTGGASISMSLDLSNVNDPANTVKGP